MEEIEFLPGDDVRGCCDEGYQKTLNGELVMFRPNGVQVIMYTDVKWIFENIVNRDEESP